MENPASHQQLAREWGNIASEGFADGARYLASVPEDEWSGPSGSAEWSIYHLAGHIAGEVVWYANLVRGITRGEAPYPRSLYEEMMSWEPKRLTARIAQGARELNEGMSEATEEHVESPVDMGFASLPMWRATFISTIEGALHGWDTKARREPDPQVPHAWAVRMADPITDFASEIVHRSQVVKWPGVYRLEVKEFGPVTVTARGGELTIERVASAAPDVTLTLTPDQYVRLITGRLHVEAGGVQIDGDRERVTGITRIFGGIANGD